MVRACLIVLTTLLTGHILTGCIVPPKPTFVSPELEVLSKDQTATLDWFDCQRQLGIACTVSVQRVEDEDRVELVPEAREYSRAELPPGTYHVQVFTYLTGGKYKDLMRIKLQGKVNFMAGHEYIVNNSSWYSDTTNPTTGSQSWWIEEAKSGDAVVGGKPPEHLPGFRYNLFYK